MKKYLIVLLLSLALLIPTTIYAKEKTIAEWESALSSEEQALADTNNKKAQTQAQIKATKDKINSIYAQMAEVQNDIQKKTDESNQLQADIKTKNEQIKDLMRYYQVSSSGSAMLEYIMGAESITDLVYRLSITEQITAYNKKTIKQMNEMIAENEKIKASLAAKKEELASLQSQMSSQLASLNNDAASLVDEGMTIEESIKDMKNTISYLKNLGCKTNETQTTCLNRIYGNSGGYLPSGTTFFRPTTTGKISSNYGARDLWGSYDFHPAIDIAMDTGTPVYAVATGRVAKVKVTPSASCGIQIVIHHQINGSYYTSYYCHLSSVNVSEGELVTSSTIIAKSGNTGDSSGPHLHLALTTGRWYTDYYNYYGSGGFIDRSFDPREVIVFPALGSSYSNR